MKTVLTYGTFDLFHIGHLNLLKRTKSYGDRLIVAVSTDEFNLQMKSKITAIPYTDRASILESMSYVDLVIPEYSWAQKIEDIKKNDVDIFVMGDDWEGKFDDLSKYCDVVYLPRTNFISTSDIKSHIRSGVRTQIGTGCN